MSNEYAEELERYVSEKRFLLKIKKEMDIPARQHVLDFKEHLWNELSDQQKIAKLEERMKEVRWYLDWLVENIGYGPVLHDLHMKLKMIKDKSEYRGKLD